MTKQPVPIYILAGFLGSGKTTLLGQAVRHMQAKGKKPAVLMNELGEVNLDGVAADVDVPMSELLGGCVCCSVKGDMGIALQQLVQKEEPDVVFIEATGVAHPMEIVDGVTEASLYMKVDLRGVVTVVDAGLLEEQLAKGKGPTYRLLEEQIRTAGVILLNKTDRVSEPVQASLQEAIRQWNPYAGICPTVQARVDLSIFEEAAGYHSPETSDTAAMHTEAADAPKPRFPQAGGGSGPMHASHEHLAVLTHYLEAAIDSEAFEAFISRLPEEVYRAKGILTFRDTTKRYLFQYAYRQPDYMAITPQAVIPDVLVFIGEHLPKELLLAELKQLEAK